MKKTPIQIILSAVCGILFMYAANHLCASEKTDVHSLQEAYAHVAENVFPAVVVIHSLKDNGRNFVPDSCGSGFFIDNSGHLITNLHVIDTADALVVQLYDKKLLPAKVVGYSKNSDLALLKVSGNAPFPYLKFADMNKLKVGHYAIAVGAPLRLSHSMTTGIVSHKGRRLGLHAKEDFIQTDAAINPGNSGGPLLNIDGEVIGVNNCIIGKRSNGLNFAISGHLAKKFADRVIALKVNGAPYLGVTLIDGNGGAEIIRVQKNSPAEKAGLQTKDIISRIDEHRINNCTYAQTAIYSYYSPGDSALFTIKRKGNTHTFRVHFEAKRID